MKVLTEIYDSPWDFTLYMTDEGFILNIDFCNGYVDVTRSYRITDKDAEGSFEGVRQLAEYIRKNHESFKDRQIIPPLSPSSNG